MTSKRKIPSSIERVLLDEGAIKTRVRELSAQISDDYTDADNPILIGVLKGSFIFLADLTRHLTVIHHVDLIALSSYSRASVTDRHVLIVEDIVDTGYTLEYLLRTFRARQPASLRTCTLLSKPDRRKIEVPLDYVGFEIADEWVVGYGLDYSDRFRTLPYIGALRKEMHH